MRVKIGGPPCLRSNPPVPTDVQPLIEQKNFDSLEDVWTQTMEEEPDDLPFFFAVAAAMKKKGGGAQALSWLRFLADFHERAMATRQSPSSWRSRGCPRRTPTSARS